jgi:O-antigen/teichoic acid export membrane protein
MMTDSTLGEVAPDATRRRRMAVDSGWILLGYAITSGAGFLFWVLCARVIAPEELGVQTALYSLVTAAASVAACGVGDALLVMLPVSGDSSPLLLRRGVTATIVIAAAAGILAGLLAAAFVPTGVPEPAVVALVTLGTVLWALFVIKDPILQALGRASWATALNAPINIAKLALLPIITLAVAVPSPLLVATGIPVIIAVGVAYVWLVPRAVASTTGQSHAGAWYRDNAAAFRTFAIRAGVAGGLYLGLDLSLPFLVTVMAGPVQGAVFAVCFRFALVLDLIPLAVGASFSSHSASDDARGSRSVVRVWLTVLGLVALAAICLVAASPFVLGFLGSSYLETGGVLLMGILALAAVLRTSYEMWCASLRARHISSPILISSIAQAAALLPLVLLLVPTQGALGAGWALLAVTAALSIVGCVGLIRTGRPSLT